MSVNLLRSDAKFLMYASLMVPDRGANNLARGLAVLWGADPMPEIIGLRGMSGLCVLGRS